MLGAYPFKIHSKLKSRGRKGIPDSFRGHAWCLLSDINTTKISNKNELAKFMQNNMDQVGNERIMADIHKDVSRTLPNHIYFQQ